jgi:type I restriction enzyme, R subunit
MFSMTGSRRTPKVQEIFDHVYLSYPSATTSVYVEATPAAGSVMTLDVETLIARLQQDSELARRVDEALREQQVQKRSLAELLAADETHDVEYKSTARWNVNEQRRDKVMEDNVTKTVAAFLNSSGGTLLIGVRNDRTIHGLTDDYAQVNPPNADGLVNWLDTMLDNTIGKSAAARIKISIAPVGQDLRGGDICRVDVPAASRPTWAKTSKHDRVFFRRRNNSTVAFADTETQALTEYIADRWPTLALAD